MKKLIWLVVVILFLAVYAKTNADFLEACQSLGHSLEYCKAQG
jgi:hypothetical protein